jgi:methionyl-tRNA formyltransferase
MNENMPAGGGSAFGGKIVFFGTSNVALPILESLNRHHQVLAVVTQPDAKVGRRQEIKESPVSVLAKEMQLKILKPSRVKDNLEFYQQLQSLGAEIFIVVSYGKILPLEIINLPKYKTLNVHFSLLPEYRGASPIQSALLNGDSETGATIFILDKKIDNGPIIAQEKVAIDNDDNYISLSEKLSFLSAKLLITVLPSYINGSIGQTPQDELRASYTKIITKEDGRIDWQKSARKIYNQFRAFYPWPGIWTKWNGKILKITDCLPIDYSKTEGLPGTTSNGGIVNCGDNTSLQIKSLQLAGKAETKILDFLNGYQQFIGSRLE